jgi:hypothetical protein
MMMFRKLYWVVEHVDAHGHSTVTGVFTSIPDLIRNGLRFIPGENRDQIRFTLCKLDSPLPPLGTWSSASFDTLESDLQPYVATEEFSAEQVARLADTLREITGVAA